MRVGPYEVVSNLGQGGAGVVLRARAPDGCDVAVKVLVNRSPGALARFERERRLLESLGSSEGFVPYVAAGEDPDHGPYVVMPFVEGGTLRARLARGPLPIDEALALGRSLATALARAHARGVVHRDLKPENVLFTADGRPLIADLGMAKHFRDDAPVARRSASLSRTGELRGTPGYMPVEQMQDAKAAGTPADVFALGAILYECLTGEPAFRGGSLLGMLHAVEVGLHEPIRAARPETPPAFAAAVEKALARDAADRFQDAASFRRALERAGGGGPRRVTLAVVAAGLAAVLAGALWAARPVSPPPAPLAPPPAPRPAPPPPPRPGPEWPAIVEAAEQRARALGHEEKGDARAALDAWYRLLDSAPATTAARGEAMEHVRTLLPSVPPNRDPARALAVLRFKVVIFARSVHEYVDALGSEHRFDRTLSARERKEVRASVQSFLQLVFDLTRGQLRIEADFDEVEQPVTRWVGKLTFKVGPAELPYDWRRVQREGYDAALAYVGVGTRQSAELIPCESHRTAHATDQEGVAGLAIGIYHFYAGDLTTSTGRNELGIFMRQLDRLLASVQGWPGHFFPYEATADGDAELWKDCHQRATKGLEAVAYDRHLLQEHLTPLMIRSLSTREQTPNPWNRGCVHAFQVAGPYPARATSLARALEADTPRDLEALGPGESLLLAVPRRLARLDFVWPRARGEQVAVAQTWVRSPLEQAALLRLGSDDGVRVYLNGAVVHEHVQVRPCHPDEDEVPVVLREGWNRIHLRVANEGGAWGFALAFVAPDGRPLEGLEFTPERRAR